MKKIIKRIFIGAGIILLLLALFTFQPWVLLPHKHIIITLPFDENGTLPGMIPMGEKFWHNASNGNPNGHPGIDFNWGYNKTPILSVAEGIVIGIKNNSEGIIVTINSGEYRNTYQELTELSPGINSLASVKKGSVIGFANHLHWDFASSSMLIDRLCPVSYFDSDSRMLIEKIWNNQPLNDFQGVKKAYPLICNGFYENRTD